MRAYIVQHYSNHGYWYDYYMGSYELVEVEYWARIMDLGSKEDYRIIYVDAPYALYDRHGEYVSPVREEKRKYFGHSVRRIEPHESLRHRKPGYKVWY